ncbi:MAG: hypothetical protein COU33_01910 [Candidatus Magasanikbacteria bacterium CG10_big_fil_rev_8_21_14_0_10_43_6]|uniref:Dockerin domain-containing protein n=1 Tax=Candidatus Magasanikbacteria bacterium CG10_big_fil_rev_8_21_14_0_10_43_6 TaxID=1974650 RepID=A0A2M6W1K3_9BACT|nr:MAG: hypothetical protein COU33_01910 [Candidatus Magasanikbacteria bacterium CG10_big_fil_rev_8_21_14_0_10_43_6]
MDRGSSIGLSWIAPVSGSPIVGYHVFRAMQSMTPVRITESAVTETSYQDAPDESGRYCYTVISVAEDGQMSIPSLERCVDFSAAPTDDLFLRGDSNNDRELDLSDAIFTLSYLFVSGSPVTCQDAADANDDGSLDLSDPVYTLSFLFLRGQAPKTPYPDTGSDPTPDELGCHAYGE